ncbi:MAG: TRAP transporter large permease [Lachnospiraceae bacterium]|nr:TRAP transporter large permease [Lachnospiraceae bacterium]
MSVSIFILLCFAVLMVLGIPVAVSLGGASILGILFYNTSSVAAAVKLMYSSMNSFTMVAVPLFFLAGVLMEKGGVAQQIFDFCQDLVGWIHGGLGHVNILTSILFAGMSGSSVADVGSIGALCANAMIRYGYPGPYSWATTLTSSMLATVIPPSILMVVAASVGQVSMGQALFAGIIPGVILGLIMMIYNYFYCKRHGIGHRVSFNLRRLAKSFIRALPALMVVVILLGGMYSGFFTATEAAAICVAYVLIISKFVYKKLHMSDLPDVFMSVAKNTGTVLFVAITAKPAGTIFTLDGFPTMVANAITSVSTNPTIVMLLIFFLLIIIGMVMDATAAIYIFLPILLPTATSVGISPLFFVVFMVIALGFGLITPPVGVCLYAAVNVSGLPMEKLSKALVPWLILMIAGLILFILFPQIITVPIAWLFG